MRERVSRRQPESATLDQTPPPDQTDIQFGSLSRAMRLAHPCESAALARPSAAVWVSSGPTPHRADSGSLYAVVTPSDAAECDIGVVNISDKADLGHVLCDP